MIMILPFLLMTLHFSQIGFTDDLTFISNPPFKKDHFRLYHRSFGFASFIFPIFPRFLLVSPDDPSFGQIVGRQLQGNPVAGQNTDEILAKLANST